MAKTINEVAKEVLRGEWGSGDTRKQKLISAGYDYDQVQAQVGIYVMERNKKIAKMNAWAIQIAADNRYHYVLWKSNDNQTHLCPICSRIDYSKDPAHFGWNCIGFAWAVWYHGGGLPINCNCHVISNDVAEQILKAKTDAEALSLARKKVGMNDIIVIRNKNGIPKSKWQAGDIGMQYNGNTYNHTFYIMGNGKIADSTGSSGKVAKNDQINIRSNGNYSAKVIIRWVGTNIKVKSIDDLAQEVLAGKWGSGDTRKQKLTNAGYNYDIIQKRVNELVVKPTDTKKPYNGAFPAMKLVKTNSEVIADTITWAKWIAGDNRFHYGGPRNSKYDGHKNGCYFCGTNSKTKPKAMKNREFSYCCNPFVGAAWAHGGCVPAALKLCQEGSSWDFHKGVGYDKSPLFTNLGHPDKSKLKPGDVLCSDTHVALYVGNGRLVEAAGGDDNVKNSAKWNNSIRVANLTDSRYKSFKRVHRFNSKVEVTMCLRHGEVSNRVKQWQAFLNWWYDGKVGTPDGIYGDNTLNWTKKFQEEQIGKGEGDGLVGPKTVAAAQKCKK